MKLFSLHTTLSVIQKVFIVTLAASLYIVGFYIAFPYIGMISGGLGLIPVIAAGLLCGKRGAFISFLGVFSIGLILLHLNNYDLTTPQALIQLIIGNMFILIAAITIGWASSLVYRVQQQNQALDEERNRLTEEIAKRKQSEINLQKQKEFNENLQLGLLFLSTEVDQKTILTNILKHLTNSIDCNSATISLYEAGHLVLHANLGHPEKDLFVEQKVSVSDHENNPGVRVFLTKEPIIIDDVTTEPGWIIFSSKPRIRSWLGVPLLFEKKAIGVVGIDSFSTRAFTRNDIQLLQAFANTISLALENQRLFQQAQHEIEERKQTAEKFQKRLKIEALINTFTVQLLNADITNVKENVKDVLKQLGQFTNSERCYLNLLGEDQFTLLNDFVWTNDQVATRAPETMITDIRQLDWVYQKLSKLETIHVPDISNLGSDAATEKNRWQKLGIRSLLLVPINRHDQLIGILGFQSENYQTNWEHEDILSLQLIANIFSSFWARHTAEKNQQEKLLFIKRIMNAIPSPVFYLDCHGVYLGCNNSFSEYYGIQKEDLVGKTAYDFNEKEIADHLLSTDFELMKNKQTRTYEEPSTYADGSQHILMVHKAPFFDLEGNTAGLIAVMMDITNQKYMEKEMEEERSSLAEKVRQQTMELRSANSELAQAAKAKDEFLASMSHELRTPLNAILGLTEALQEQIYGPLTDKQKDTLTLIQQSGSHLLSLISDILDLAKIGANRMELDTAPVDANYICETAFSMLREIAQSKQIELVLKLDPQVKIIYADGRRLKQILLNLLSNAIKFTSPNGKISMEMEGDPQKNLVHFHIRDNGIGIAPENLDTIFKPFQQIDSSLSRRYNGAGLGLALAAQMTELHHGIITVESVPEQGSHFCVSLPWTSAGLDHHFEQDNKHLKDTVIPSKNSEVASPVVLIVEDDPATLETMSDYLIAKGYQVKIASNGKQAYIEAKLFPPNLILMDIQMPVMDGLETTKRMRKEPALARIPIIALTALAMPGDKEKCLAAGANDYMVKPVQLATLVKTIQNHLASD